MQLHVLDPRQLPKVLRSKEVQRCFTKGVLMGSYTYSPLTWSIAIDPDASFSSVRHLKRIAISRYGSGSHVMAIVLGMRFLASAILIAEVVFIDHCWILLQEAHLVSVTYSLLEPFSYLAILFT